MKKEDFGKLKDTPPDARKRHHTILKTFLATLTTLQGSFAAIVDEPAQFAPQVFAMDDHIDKPMLLQKF